MPARCAADKITERGRGVGAGTPAQPRAGAKQGRLGRQSGQALDGSTHARRLGIYLRVLEIRGDAFGAHFGRQEM
jgi:hypothetical protein